MGVVRFPSAVDVALPPELEARLGAVTLRGTSVAARATAFAVPEMGVCLDIGRLTEALVAQPVVLLSHGHLDHLSGILAYLNVRARFHPEPPARVVAPSCVAEGLRAALAVMPGMESVRTRVALERAVLPAEPGDTVELPGGSATAFAADHGSASLGWALRQPGRDRPVLVYAGDGSVEPFRADPGLLDADAAVVECTFVEPNRRIAARIARHAHVLDWIEVAPSLPCDRLVLAHLPALPAAELEALTAPLAAVWPGELVLWAPRG
ncbi:MAG: MBL fold metallo-hydrolase [Acidobacteriota bacterium]